MAGAASPDLAAAFFAEAFDPANRDNPYAVYRRFRETTPVISTEIGLHLALSHGACAKVLRHPSASSDERRGTYFQMMAASNPRLAAVAERRPSLLFMDPPEHTRLRGLVAPAFGPRRVDQLRGLIRRTADELVTAMAERGDTTVDIIEQFAYPLPIRVICTLLGVPAADHEQFRHWSATLTRAVDPRMLRSDDDNAEIEEAGDQLRRYTEAMIDERRRHPGDDLLSDLLRPSTEPTTRPDELLDDGELNELVTLILVAGHETTVNLIGNGLAALLDHPDQLAEWTAQPTLADSSVDELLRFDSPVQLAQRIATEPLELDGTTIPPGDQVIVILASANRDPTVFDDPDRLDIRRSNANRHIAFGGGIHHCLGAALARAEGAIALSTLLRAFPGIQAAGPSPVRPTFTLRGRSELPVHLGRRRSGGPFPRGG